MRTQRGPNDSIQSVHLERRVSRAQQGESAASKCTEGRAEKNPTIVIAQLSPCHGREGFPVLCFPVPYLPDGWLSLGENQEDALVLRRFWPVGPFQFPSPVRSQGSPWATPLPSAPVFPGPPGLIS